MTFSPRLDFTVCWIRSNCAEAGRDGDSAGHLSSSAAASSSEDERRKGFSVASISDRRWMGDFETMVATGRLGRGLSGGLDRCGFVDAG